MKLTVAIPTHNRQDYLPDLLKSLQNQTFKDFKVVVFDDQSSYDVQALLNGFKDLNIQLIKSEKSYGNVGNFGRIVTYPHDTEYLIVFHDDDVMHPRLLEREVKVLDSYPHAVFVGTGLHFVHDNSKMFKFQDVSDELNLKVFKHPADFLRLMLKDFPFCFGSTMYRVGKLHFDANFSTPLHTWHDRPYLLTLAAKGEACVVDEPLVNYRIHLAQVSQAKPYPGQLEIFKKNMNFYRKFLPQDLNSSDTKLFYSNSTYGIIAYFLFYKLPFSELKKNLNDPLVKFSSLNLKQCLRLLAFLLG